MKTNKDIFKVGDRVFHIQFGWGIIEEEIADMWMLVFESRSKRDDKVGINKFGSKLLSFTEYSLEGFSQERPKELPKRGDVVWGKNFDEDNWHIGHFYLFDKSSVSLKYCISSNPAGNKNLWVQEITTTNPYEND
jgi:hypothetical protein